MLQGTTTSPTLSTLGINFYPISNFVSYSNLSSHHKLFTLKLSSISEPTSYSTDVLDPNWKGVINNELQSLINTHTWDLTPLPHNKCVIGCKWIFKLNFLANGTIERYKAHLVAKGFNQIDGLDYYDAFSHVIKMTTIRLLLSIVANQNWFLH